jgi:hypothetical protein
MSCVIIEHTTFRFILFFDFSAGHTKERLYGLGHVSWPLEKGVVQCDKNCS